MTITKALIQYAIFSISLSLFSPVAQSAFALNPNGQWLLGEWGGRRAALQEQGYKFLLDYTGEYASVLDSRLYDNGGSAYTGQLSLGTNFDLNKIFGWQDTEAQIVVTYRDGQSLSQTAAGLRGHISSVQEVWGRGQTWRLTNLWLKKKFLNGALDIKFGRFGEGEDFNSFGCDFQNLALCGSKVGNYVDQWYNWPVSQWALRAKYNLRSDLYVQIGAYEYNPENLKRSKGFNLSTDGSRGAIIPTEAVWTPKLGKQALAGEYRLGYYLGTADAEELANPARSSNKAGAWLIVKQQLTRKNNQGDQGIYGFMHITIHDSKTNRVKGSQNAGLVYVGLFDRRPKDELAVGIARIQVNKSVGDSLGAEYNAELFYGMHVANWLTIRPNIQMVRNVGAVKNGDRTWVGGLKFKAVF